MFDLDRLQRAYDTVRGDLIAQCSPAGHWTGELCSSALATATAVSALSLVERHAHQRGGEGLSEEVHAELSRLICGGLRWLAASQNPDGGWGDTDRSLSNLAATMLVRAAFRLTAVPAGFDNLLERAEAFIENEGGVPALKRRFGGERIFAAPMLANCALAGIVSWRDVAPLPFELACAPASWFQALRMPMVGFAIPALVAVGQARDYHRKSYNPLARFVRRATRGKSLEILARIQPADGGYLEAVPLTSCVVMCLASMELTSHEVVRRGVEFLRATVRPDGSWPIEADMATRATTLAVNALAAGGEPVSQLDCLPWLLRCQKRGSDQVTGARAGGWGWTDRDGAVAEVDDTAGALLALAALNRGQDAAEQDAVVEAAREGVAWLLGTQNRDGGWPTFHRGAGRTTFDRSGPNLTAQALRALAAWQQADLSGARFPRLARPQREVPGVAAAMASAIERGFTYLESTQSGDGSWTPLWYGNQHRTDETNPQLGTARVLAAYRDLERLDAPAAGRGVAWLLSQQNADGGWGGRGAAGGKPRRRDCFSTVEETALAVEALVPYAERDDVAGRLESGVAWLTEAIAGGAQHRASPIGLYFARLWYYERVYPLAWAVSALGHALRRTPLVEPGRTEQVPIAT